MEIGVYNKTHGIGGEISATMMCDQETSRKFSCYISPVDGIYVPFYAESARPKNQQTLLLKLQGVDSETEARTLVGSPIFVGKDEYSALSRQADSDELPVDYFVGFTIFDAATGRKIGVITDVDDQTENVLFVASDDRGAEILIPAAADLVAEIDFDSRRIMMSLPDGLLD